MIAHSKSKKPNRVWISVIFFGIILGIIFVIVFSNNPDGNPLYTVCMAKYNYICQSPKLLSDGSSAILNLLLAQVTNATWNDTNFIWVPNWQQMLNSEIICPVGTNEINGGISCGIPSGLGLHSGTPITVNFTFNSKNIVNGATYYGQIWAEYKDLNGTWHSTQMTSEVKLRAYTPG